MAITSVAGKVRPTRGELLKLKRRLESLEEGLEVLTMKRDQLNKTLQSDVKGIIDERLRVEERIRGAYKAMISAYMAVGSSEVEMQAASIQGMLQVKALDKSIMGTTVPRIEVFRPQSLNGQLGVVESRVAWRFHNLIDDLLKLVEKEGEVIRIAGELEKTNRKVNALEKIAIPNLQREIKYIEDVLEEEELEEFTSMKLLREIVLRRRL